MSSLLVFLIAYGGVGGTDVKQIDKQVRGLVEAQTEVQDVKLTAKQRKTLVRHGDGAAEIVRDLEVTGLITGEVERKKKSSVLHVVVYGADGALLDLLELPLGKKKAKKLGKDALESLEETIVKDIETLTAPPPEPEPEVAASDDDDGDDEDPLGGEERAEVVAVAPGAPRRRGPRLKVWAGAGMASRRFDPGPADVRGYSSSMVPSATVAVEVAPVRFLAIGGSFERTLVMNTQLEGESVPSSILGWTATAAVGMSAGPLDVAAVGGVGGREFVIASDMPAPSPDGLYTYATIGARLTMRLGERVALRAAGAYQPVIAGDPDMAETPSSRAGYDVSGALEIGASEHVFVVGEGGFQRFTWTWDDGASADSYPRASLSVGARY